MGGRGAVKASKRVTYASAKANVSITTSMATLIDVQNRCSRLNTAPALPRKPVAEVSAAGEQRLYPDLHGIAEALLGELLRPGAGSSRIEAALEGLEPPEG